VNRLGNPVASGGLVRNYLGGSASVLLAFASLRVAASIRYVDAHGANPTAPYTTWTTAATNIQDAIDVATTGDFILVTNGVYQTGARVVSGQTNRVALTVPVTVQSVNGPDGTIIQGGDATRCVYMTNGSVLSGFTLTNAASVGYGGGAYCESKSAILVDCIIVSNSAFSAGAAFGGTLESCLLKNNSGIYGGAVASATLNNCVVVSNSCGAGALYNCTANGCALSNNAARGYGGGATGGVLSDCVLLGNSAQEGGGAWGATLINCLVASNSASGNGGGASQTALDHCVVTNNIAAAAGGAVYGGGGAYQCTLTNCLVAGNYATSGGGANQGILDHCTVANNSSGALGGGAYDATISQSVISNNYAGTDGGGAFGALNNCTIVSNSAQNGGGACSGTLSNCTLLSNIATRLYYPRGGGAYSSTLSNCTIATNSASQGGGVNGGWLNNCIIIGNTAADGGGAGGYATMSNCVIGANWGNGGGGISFCVAYNSVLTNNSGYRGGGSRDGSLNNCTIVGNSADIGGGASGGFVNNCIVYANSGSNYDSGDFTQLKMSYCCTTPMLTNGFGNITNNPGFINLALGDLRLAANSPCINAGYNLYVTGGADLAGNPRIKGGTVDIGAYEFQTPSSVISYEWLGRYGFATDGSSDFLDSDKDGMNNWQEWRAGTVPTDPSSVLKLFPPVVSNANASALTVTWSSVTGRNYFVERSTNLAVFTQVSSDIPGLPGTTAFADTNTVGSSRFFYRVGVR
jgi:hypothetical protein